MWATFSIVYANDPKGRKPFFADIMEPLIHKHADLIHFEDGDRCLAPIPVLDESRRILTDYIADGNSREFGDVFLRFIDAFLQLRVPRFKASAADADSVDTIGMAIGEFLQDPVVARARSNLALSAQSILGIYEYPEIDTFQRHRGVMRCIAFLTGKSIDYLSALDFQFDPSADPAPFNDKNVDLFNGFCIPGRAFSPIVMRSARTRERLNGLLYTPGVLVDLSGPLFDDLTLEVFTTDKAHQGSRPDLLTDPAFVRTLALHYGPRLRRFLKRVHDPDRQKFLRRIVDRLKLKVL